jgi:dephospho-CoA kinase
MLDFATFCKIGKSIKRMRLLRDKELAQGSVLYDAGWHFSSMGSVHNIMVKLTSYEHSEHNQPEILDSQNILQRIQLGNSIFPDNKSKFCLQNLDHTYPKYLLDNRQKFSHLLATL